VAYLFPMLICIYKHNGDGTSKDCVSYFSGN